MPPVKKKRCQLTALQKKEICLRKKQKPTPKNLELAVEFNCGESTISDILKQSDKWLAVVSGSQDANNIKDRGLKWPQHDAALAIWIQSVISSNQDLTGDIIKTKAKYFAESLQINDFKASNGWLTRFKE